MSFKSSNLRWWVGGPFAFSDAGGAILVAAEVALFVPTFGLCRGWNDADLARGGCAVDA